MLKWLMIVIVAFFVGTFAWGWYVNVRGEGMSFDGYVRYYQRQVQSQSTEIWKKLTGPFHPSGPVKRATLNLPS